MGHANGDASTSAPDLPHANPAAADSSPPNGAPPRRPQTQADSSPPPGGHAADEGAPKWPDRPRSRSPSHVRRSSSSSASDKTASHSGYLYPNRANTPGVASYGRKAGFKSSSGRAEQLPGIKGSVSGVLGRLRKVVGKEDNFQGGGELSRDSNSILQEWQTQPKNAPLMELSTANAVFILNTDQRQFAQLRNGSALELLMTIMESHRANVTIQANGCNLLAGIVGADSQLLDRSVAFGGLHLVIDAAKRHKEDLEVQEKAIGAMRRMTLVPSNRTIIFESGGIEVVVGAMQRFLKSSTAIQAQGCLVLANMAYGSLVNKNKIGQSGGAEAIVRSMEVYAEDATVQYRACLALRNISWGSEENCTKIGECGGLSVIIKSLETHQNSVTVLGQAMIALCNIALGNEDNLLLFDQSKGLENVINAMRLFKEDTLIQEYAIALVNSRLASGDENIRLFCSNGGVEALIDSVCSCTWSDVVLEGGCFALNRLLPSQENKDRAYAHAGLDKLVLALYRISKRVKQAPASTNST